MRVHAANPDVAIVVQGRPLDPSTVWVETSEYPLVWHGAASEEPIILRIIEWEQNVGRTLALCDASGVVLDQVPPATLKNILQRTSLTQVIKATSQVTDRLDFLAALKLMVFDPQLRRTVKERAELHKILERETWVFGDTYTLVVGDQSLDAVLARHLHHLDRQSDLDSASPVRREDGSTGIVDLMLGRAHRGSAGREHLIVELKAPGVKIGQKEVGQIKSYAQAVTADPQFHDARVSWDFWIVSTEMEDIVRLDANSPGKPAGCLQEWDGGVRIWAKTWSEIIEEHQG